MISHVIKNLRKRKSLNKKQQCITQQRTHTESLHPPLSSSSGDAHTFDISAGLLTTLTCGQPAVVVTGAENSGLVRAKDSNALLTSIFMPQCCG